MTQSSTSNNKKVHPGLRNVMHEKITLRLKNNLIGKANNHQQYGHCNVTKLLFIYMIGKFVNILVDRGHLGI